MYIEYIDQFLNSNLEVENDKCFDNESFLFILMK